MMDILSYSLLVLAISLSLYVILSKKQNEKQSSNPIDWNSVLKWLSIPCVIIFAVICIVIFPKMSNDVFAASSQALAVMPSMGWLILGVFGFSFIFGTASMLYSFREPKALIRDKETEKP